MAADARKLAPTRPLRCVGQHSAAPFDRMDTVCGRRWSPRQGQATLNDPIPRRLSMTTNNQEAVRELSASDIDAVSGGIWEILLIAGIAVAVWVAVSAITSGNRGHGTSVHHT